jgi:hypothetical protein
MELKEKTDLETIENIIKWIHQTKIYDKTAIIWKTASDIVVSKKVDCGTASFVAVALARANGIPARQVWGVIDAGRSFSPEGYLKGHAWFEFYLKGAGWIPVEQFDSSSIAILPISYIRIMTTKTDMNNNKYIPLYNIMNIMNTEPWYDIVKYQRKETGN